MEKAAANLEALEESRAACVMPPSEWDTLLEVMHRVREMVRETGERLDRATVLIANLHACLDQEKLRVDQAVDRVLDCNQQI